ncbi:hypothetical protein [Nonomuraea sp. NPDC005501]|uniref:hypothetical protein n=1 Tax=Nonomuraea sp. NPDC005501 TaxID=3156884 RepID=UPI0033B63D46
MLDLRMEVDHLKGRVDALEARTFSGVPDMSIAERFDQVHDRVDLVARNILDKIDERYTQLDTRIDETQAEMRRGFEAIDRRFDGIDQQFKAIDRRFERVEGHVSHLRTDVSDIKAMLMSLGAKAPENV